MKSCVICEKGHNTANWRSHSNIASKRRQKVNLQFVSYEGDRVMACTRCRRTLAKDKA